MTFKTFLLFGKLVEAILIGILCQDNFQSFFVIFGNVFFVHRPEMAFIRRTDSGVKLFFKVFLIFFENLLSATQVMYIKAMSLNSMSTGSTRQEAIVAEYKDMAAGYDQGSAECGWNAPTTLARFLEDRKLLKSDMEILDFAVGTGALTEAFRNSGETGKSLHITATDLSTDMLNKCLEKGVADIAFQQDITKPWDLIDAGSKDIVAGTGVAEYLTHSELAETVRHATSALKAGGVLAFTFLPAAESDDLSAPDQQQAHKLSYIKALFEQNGIRLKAAEPFTAYTADDGSSIQHVMAVGIK